MKQFLLSVWEVLEVVLVAALTVFFIRTFLVQPFLVSGASMEPNFSNGDYLIVDEISYRLREPNRFESIVFKYPIDPSLYYIKRIIGLPGERVIINNGIVKIFNKEHMEGLQLEERYLPSNVQTLGSIDITLGEGKYFVMGDNRNKSYDSRAWGVLPKENLIGVVRLRLLPLNEIKAFSY